MRQIQLDRNLAEEIRQTQVPEGAVAIWWLGQASVIIKGAGKTVGFDLYLTNYGLDGAGIQREFDPLIKPAEVDFLDVVFCTHEHLDHLDPWTLQAIAQASPMTRFVLPNPILQAALDAGIERSRIDPSWAGQQINVAGIAISPIPAAHSTSYGFEDAEKGHRWQGYVVQLGPVTVCHTGDTIVYDGMVEELRRYNVQLLLGPINGRDYFRTQQQIIGNMDVRELAELAVQAGVKLVIPLHYDLFFVNQEQPGRFVDYLYKYFPTQPAKVMAHGERFFYFSG